MIVSRSLPTVRAWRERLQRGESLGLVPTMGALHDGHVSLIRAAREDCQHVAVTVFVNPTQFGPGEDFAEYPREPEGDTRRVKEAGADVLWFAAADELYPPGFATQVTVANLARVLCGRERPHHFGGVALIVLKLLHIFRPHRAYFGRKDYQQFVLIRRMVRDLDLGVEVVDLPTVRASTGLALSSRNLRLSDEGRRAAEALYAGLRAGANAFAAGERRASRVIMAAAEPILAERSIRLEYLDLVDAENLEEVGEIERDAVLALAARVDGVRLIDNIALPLKQLPP